MATAASDLATKLIHEKRLLGFARSFAAALAERLRVSLRTGVTPALMAPGVAVLAPELRRHYDLVARDFDHQMSDEMPDDLKPGEIEQGLIRQILDQKFEQRSQEIAAVAMETSQQHAEQSALRAQRLVREPDSGLAEEGIARLASNIFLTGQRSRAATLANVETQWSAETSKGVEVGVLLGELDGARKAAAGGERKITEGKAIKTWRSQGDSRVRTFDEGPFDHLIVDGQQVDSDKPFKVSGELLMWPGDSSLGASKGNFINCFPAGVRVDAEATSAQRAVYDGEMCRIEVAGSILSVTPNHPIATPGGFVAAGHLREGDRVLADSRCVENPGTLAATIREHDEEDMPPKIEDVFRSLEEFTDSSTTKMIARTDDFYGDGRFLDGQVDVVTADGELRNNVQMMAAERSLHGLLVQESMRDVGLSGKSVFSPLLFRANAASRSIMRSARLATAFVLRHLAPLQGLGLRRSSQLNTAGQEHSVDRSTADSKILRKLIDASPFEVSPLQIVSVERHSVVAHVYDVSTRSGLLVANGIITSNCRCSAIYDVDTVIELRKLFTRRIFDDLAVIPVTESELVIGLDFDAVDV